MSVSKGKVLFDQAKTTILCKNVISLIRINTIYNYSDI